MCKNCDDIALANRSDYPAMLHEAAADMKAATGDRNQSDTKALGLLAVVVSAIGLEATVLVTVPGRLGLAGGATLVASALLFLAAVVAFGLSIRPRLPRRGAPTTADKDWGVVWAADHKPIDLAETYRARTAKPELLLFARATAVHFQSIRVVRKYRLVARGIDLSLAGLVLALAAAIVAALT
jgi:hypothetical protein